MKYILTLLCLVSFVAYGQEPAYTPMRLNYQFRGIKVDSLFLIPSFNDTTAANSSTMKNVAGAMIRTGNDFWMRNATTNAWLQNVNIGSGASPIVNFVNNVFKKVGTDSVFYVVAPADTFFSFRDSYIDTVISVTYNELVSLKSSMQLKNNSHYLINNYRTEFRIFGTAVDTFGSLEPLIVKAIGDSSISTTAFSLLHPKDIIEYTTENIGQLKPNSGGRGTILYRQSLDSNLSAHFDWRNILWQRWAISSAPGLYVAFTQFNSINSFEYQKTFGTNCRDISLGAEVYNVTIRDNCYSIKLLGNTGIFTSGVTILNSCHDITIGENCSQVQTTGSGYIGGIYIGSSCWYIDIGKRSYNIAIGSGAYSVMLGNQQSDVYIRPNIYRRRLEKGFSNFDVTTSISSKTINLYNVNIDALPGYLYNTAQYCGIVNLTSSNAVDTLDNITALLTSVTFQPIEIRPAATQKIVLTTNGNIQLNSPTFEVDGSKGEYVTLYKRMVDGLSTQPSKFYILNTNAIGNSGNIDLQQVTDNGNSTNNKIEIRSNIIDFIDTTTNAKMSIGTNSGYGPNLNNPFIYITDVNDSKDLFSLTTNLNNDEANMYVAGTISSSDLVTPHYQRLKSIYNSLPDSSLTSYLDIKGGDLIFNLYKYNYPNINYFDTVKLLPIHAFNRPPSTYYLPASISNNNKDTLATLRDVRDYAVDSTAIQLNITDSLFIVETYPLGNDLLKIDTLGNAELGDIAGGKYIKVDQAGDKIILNCGNPPEIYNPSILATSLIQAMYSENAINISAADYTIQTVGFYVVSNADNSGTYEMIFPAAAQFKGLSFSIVNTDAADDCYLSVGTGNIYDRGTGNALAVIPPTQIGIFYSDGTNWYGYTQ